jgi:hypothetical protein
MNAGKCHSVNLMGVGFNSYTSQLLIPILRLMFLNHKFCQFNPDLQVISQSTILTIEDTGVPNYLIEVVGKYTSTVFSPLLDQWNAS